MSSLLFNIYGSTHYYLDARVIKFSIRTMMQCSIALVMIHPFFIFCLAFPAQADACEIDIYSYVEPDDSIKVYRYESTTEAALPEMSFDDFIGSYTYTPIESEVTENQKILTVNVTQDGLPDYFPADYSIQFIQTAGDGYYSVEFDTAGKATEHLILPECVEVGASWETSSFWHVEKLVSKGGIDLPIGHFDNCLTIEFSATERTDASKKVGERQNGQSIRCQGIGLVSTTIINKINAVNFQTVTTMILDSHKLID